MSRVPRPLARRLDRLARAAHAFHRFAHHPLCDAYRPEVIRIGRRARVCRGCALALGGGLAGLAAALTAPPPPAAALAALLAAAAATAWAAARARAGRHAPKALTRATPAALAAAACAWGIRRVDAAGLAIACGAALATAAALARYRRRGPDRTPCAACPERDAPRACSGFRPMLRREAAFGRIAGRLLDAGAPRRAAHLAGRR